MKTRTLLATTALTLGLTLTACGGEAVSTAPSVPQTPHTPESTSQTWTDPAPAESEAYPGLSAEDLDQVFLLTVQDMAQDPATLALPDSELLAMGATVCPDVEAGATFDQFYFPGVDTFDAPVIAGAAVGAYCPELSAAAGGSL